MHVYVYIRYVKTNVAVIRGGFMVRSESKISPRGVAYLNRLSVCCVTRPRRKSDDFAGL